ncbi:uncharacterized protein LOC123681057 [Harmonia axyridis]|uniref:uncharacterized protein LOC123681057 n=1 Tax=Harmonia axyridis TaxID=115357 RepID=UPI001E278BC2|nr:uncharacterized protein LOC123681057 [Harmonia axyridis]
MPQQSTKWKMEKIVSSTPKKRKRDNSEDDIDSKDKEIIEEFEDGLEKSLTEKAAKSNLNETAVKIILRYVVSDENVVALLKQKENDKNDPAILPYEPKITRSKAKELAHSGSSILSAQWDKSNSSTSNVKELLTEELHEDSSDDEYVPVEEESEDDSSVCCSVSNPPTPSTTQKLLDDEIFKTPQSIKIKDDKLEDENILELEDEANIALRTRSKLSLNETPLEELEQSFLPPDITSDMYDFDCNDDDWKNFLNSFTQPLEEVVKNTEEEDLDPEYNILADEDITKVDAEELRDDRGVRVPKRELNDLIAELFEYVDIYENRKDFEQDNLDIIIDPDSYPIQELELDRYIEIFDGNSNKQIYLNMDDNVPALYERLPLQSENPLSGLFSVVQMKLLQQQMAQHIQMLTQNFFLTFQHPYFSEYAGEMKEYLMNLKLLSEGKEFSAFDSINLKSALELVEQWEKMFEEENETASKTVQHFKDTMEESYECFKNKKYYYYLPFPDSIMETFAESDVFMYPQLLPKNPFKHPSLQKCEYAPFTISELQLIAIGLEQFTQFLINDKEFLTNRKQINMAKIAEVIQKLLMPGRRRSQVLKQIYELKNSKKYPNNPIAFYFKNKRAPYTVHRVYDLEKFGVLPPKKRPPNLLPRQWRFHIHGSYDMTDSSGKQIDENELANVDMAMPDYSELNKTSQPKEPVKLRKILPAGKIPEPTFAKPVSIPKKITDHTIKNARRKLRVAFEKNIPYVKYISLRKDKVFLKKYFPHIFIAELNRPSLCDLTNMPFLNEYNEEEINGPSERNNINGKVSNSTVKSVGTDQSIVEKENGNEEREKLTQLSNLMPSDTTIEKKRRGDYCRDYMDKLQKTLGFNGFNQWLRSFMLTQKPDAIDVYEILRPILSPKYQDLADDFLFFLTSVQATALGQIIPFLIVHHLESFLRNLVIHLEDQPSQLMKVYETLQDCSDTPTANLERINSAINPLLESNPLLCDKFLHIFLETSISILTNGACNAMDVDRKLKRAKEEGIFENFTINEDISSTYSAQTTEYQAFKHQTIVLVENILLTVDEDVDENIGLSAPDEVANKPNEEVHCDDQIFTENEMNSKKSNVKICQPPKKKPTKPRKSTKKNKSVISSGKSEEKTSPKKRSPILKSPDSSNVVKSIESTPISEEVCNSLPSLEDILIVLPNIVAGENSGCNCNCHKTEEDHPLEHFCDDCNLKCIQEKMKFQTSKETQPINNISDHDVQQDSLRIAVKRKRTGPSSVVNEEEPVDNNLVLTGQSKVRKIAPKNVPPVDTSITLSPKSLLKEKKRQEYNKLRRRKRIFKRFFFQTIPYVKYLYLRDGPEFLIKHFPHLSTLDFGKAKDEDMNSLPSMPCLDFFSQLQNEEICRGFQSEPLLESGCDKEPLNEISKKLLLESGCDVEPLNEISKRTSIESRCDEEPSNEISKSQNTISKDSLEDINALMVSSSTVKNVRKELSLQEKRKAKRRKEYLAIIAMLTPLDPVIEKKKREEFAQAYMKKLQETLDKEDFQILLELFNDENGDAVDLYKSLKPILCPKYQDLADEFLLFLTAEQASAVGQLIPFFIMNHMAKFLKNLEIYFRDQPSQLRKVYKNLQDLSDTPDVNLERIKSTILPLLKNNPLLCDSFLQIFLEETPTATLLNGAWDVIDVNKELVKAKEDGVFEIIAVTDEDSACTCKCHKAEGDQTSKHHCDNCGLRFFQGKVYCQTSKGMKPVNISFPFDPDIDHKARLTDPNKAKRVDSNSGKLANSPNKEIQDDGQTYIANETDGRKRKVRVCRSPKKTTTKPKRSTKKDKSTDSPKSSEDKSTPNKSPRKRSAIHKVTNCSNAAELPEKSIPISEDDWKNLPSPEYMNLASDSESSQENEATLINSGLGEVKVEEICFTKQENVIGEVSDRWTREEDRILLETFKEYSNHEPITLIKEHLKNRTEEEIRVRFDNLMTLLQEMYSKEDSKISIS